MDRSMYFCVILLLIFFCGDLASCACAAHQIEDRQTILGQNVSFRCQSNCANLHWLNDRTRSYVAKGVCNKTCVTDDGYTHTLDIVNVSFSDVGRYDCICFKQGRPGEHLACYNLKIIPQISIIVNREPSIYNCSEGLSSSEHIINSNDDSEITIHCYEGASVNTTCIKQEDDTITTNIRRLIPGNYACLISCITNKDSTEGPENCSVNISLLVSGQPSTFKAPLALTTDPWLNVNLTNRDTTNASAALIPLVSVVCLLLLIAVGLFLYAFWPRSHRRPKTKITANFIEASNSGNSEVPPTYAKVNKSLDTDLSPSPMEPALANGTDDNLYYDVRNTNEGDITPHQDSRTHKSSISAMLYSQVNKNEYNCPPAQEVSASNDPYSEVNRDCESKAENEKGGGYEKVADSQKEDQITLERDASCNSDRIIDYEDVNENNPMGTDFAGLYAKVDKEFEGCEKNSNMVSGKREGMGEYEEVLNFQKDRQNTGESHATCRGNQIVDYETLNENDPDDNDFAGMYAIVDKKSKTTHE